MWICMTSIALMVCHKVTPCWTYVLWKKSSRKGTRLRASGPGKSAASQSAHFPWCLFVSQQSCPSSAEREDMKKEGAGEKNYKGWWGAWNFSSPAELLGMQRSDGMGKTQGWEPFPAQSLLRVALWLEPSIRGTEASYWGAFWSQAKSRTGLSLKERIQIAEEWKVAWEFFFYEGLGLFPSWITQLPLSCSFPAQSVLMGNLQCHSYRLHRCQSMKNYGSVVPEKMQGKWGEALSKGWVDTARVAV